jgi:hypothetical protein
MRTPSGATWTTAQESRACALSVGSSTSTPSAFPTTSWNGSFVLSLPQRASPPPLTKQIVNEFEVDFFWPELGLVVETDGWRYHRTPSAQTRDALRFQRHTASGLTPLRFSHYQVKYEPRHVREILEKTASNLRGRPAPSQSK